MTTMYCRHLQLYGSRRQDNVQPRWTHTIYSPLSAISRTAIQSVRDFPSGVNNETLLLGPLKVQVTELVPCRVAEMCAFSLWRNVCRKLQRLRYGVKVKRLTINLVVLCLRSCYIYRYSVIEYFVELHTHKLISDLTAILIWHCCKYRDRPYTEDGIACCVFADWAFSSLWNLWTLTVVFLFAFHSEQLIQLISE